MEYAESTARVPVSYRPSCDNRPLVLLRRRPSCSTCQRITCSRHSLPRKRSASGSAPCCGKQTCSVACCGWRNVPLKSANVAGKRGAAVISDSDLPGLLDVAALAEAIADRLAEKLRSEAHQLLDRHQLAERLRIGERT